MKHKCPNCGCEFAEVILSESPPQDIALEAARQISNHWRSGRFRKDGGVVEGITPIVQEAIDASLTDSRQYAAKYTEELRHQLKQTERVRDEWANEFRKLRDELHPPLPNKNV